MPYVRCMRRKLAAAGAMLGMLSGCSTSPSAAGLGRGVELMGLLGPDFGDRPDYGCIGAFIRDSGVSESVMDEIEAESAGRSSSHRLSDSDGQALAAALRVARQSC